MRDESEMGGDVVGRIRNGSGREGRREKRERVKEKGSGKDEETEEKGTCGYRRGI